MFNRVGDGIDGDSMMIPVKINPFRAIAIANILDQPQGANIPITNRCGGDQ